MHLISYDKNTLEIITSVVKVGIRLWHGLDIELTVDVIRYHVIARWLTAAQTYYPVDCSQMAPECRLLKLSLKSLTLNQHISIEVETILQFSFSPTSLKMEFLTGRFDCFQAVVHRIPIFTVECFQSFIFSLLTINIAVIITITPLLSQTCINLSRAHRTFHASVKPDWSLRSTP